MKAYQGVRLKVPVAGAEKLAAGMRVGAAFLVWALTHWLAMIGTPTPVPKSDEDSKLLRRQIVTDRGKADLVLVFSQQVRGLVPQWPFR